jgi:hypothetical protein
MKSLSSNPAASAAKHRSTIRLSPIGAAIPTASAMVTEAVVLFIVAKIRLNIHVFICGPKLA